MEKWLLNEYKCIISLKVDLKNMITFYTNYQDIAQQNHSTYNV